MDLIDLKNTLINMGEIVAIATVKQLNPSFDEVKFREACKLAPGERWLRSHIQKGNITQIRRGNAANSPIYYSRLEIAALMKAELINNP